MIELAQVTPRTFGLSGRVEGLPGHVIWKLPLEEDYLWLVSGIGVPHGLNGRIAFVEISNPAFLEPEEGRKKRENLLLELVSEPLIQDWNLPEGIRIPLETDGGFVLRHREGLLSLSPPIMLTHPTWIVGTGLADWHTEKLGSLVELLVTGGLGERSREKLPICAKCGAQELPS